MPRPVWTCHLGRVGYEPTAALQRALRAAREAGALPDVLLTLEHEPVITTGHRTEPHEIVHARATGIPVVPTERGGKATYHGPGQLVLYPVFDLHGHGEDIRAFVRGLEQALIDTLHLLDIEAARRDGYPGVWVAARKIASVGIRVTKWVSFHGIALNVSCDLTPFASFTPCGIADVEMTSILRERGQAPTVEEARAVLVDAVAREFGLFATVVPRARLEAITHEFQVPAPSLANAAGEGRRAAPHESEPLVLTGGGS